MNVEARNRSRVTVCLLCGHRNSLAERVCTDCGDPLVTAKFRSSDLIPPHIIVGIWWVLWTLTGVGLLMDSNPDWSLTSGGLLVAISVGALLAIGGMARHHGMLSLSLGVLWVMMFVVAVLFGLNSLRQVSRSSGPLLISIASTFLVGILIRINLRALPKRASP